MFYRQMPVQIKGYELAAGCQVFYRKIYGYFYSVFVSAITHIFVFVVSSWASQPFGIFKSVKKMDFNCKTMPF